jgi:hypothetical protein
MYSVIHYITIKSVALKIAFGGWFYVEFFQWVGHIFIAASGPLCLSSVIQISIADTSFRRNCMIR